MKLYIDSCDILGIKQLNSMLEISGVTTNPSILAGASREPAETIEELSSVLDAGQKLFVQVIRTDFEGIMEEARIISSFHGGNTAVKIPATSEGYKAMRKCREEGIEVLATAIFSAEQGLLSAMNGAQYLAPYVNRMCNYTDGIAEVQCLMDMLDSSSLNSEIIAASFKNVNQLHALMASGIDAVTVPCELIFKMMGHVGTDEAVKGFSSVWHEAFGRDTLLKK